jgi:hypothetical protein
MTTSPETLTALAEAACQAVSTRRDGTCWHHTVNVRPGKRCPLVIELYSCMAVKKWAALVAKEVTDLGHKVVIGKIVKRWIDGGYGCRSIQNGYSCWISVVS